ncbi:hypothetical protein [Pedobacter sp. AK017]|uniref:hypothetical protein n=1 Tax=Pedobacter sp. AK017 TaxID=2723073 RepID=UPI00160CFC76|nr:hypothetical protein [Pedobacter sp. AK017]
MLKDMETQFVNDESGMPVKVIIGYDDYLKIAEQLHLPLAPTATIKEPDTFDWYTSTESANSILSGLIALASREERKELDKAIPDESRVAELSALGKEALEQYNNTENFSSPEKMKAIIDKYSPILLAQKKKLQF